MTIDWITVSAQIINFLLLVWLLKRFLYQPVMQAMARREQRIAERLDQAQEREQQAEQKVQHYQEQSHELERKREEILSQTREEAEQEKSQMLDDAREQVARRRTQWRQQANEEKAEFLTSLRQQAADVIQDIARKALADLANAELEERVVQEFIARLKSLDKQSREALRRHTGKVRVSSTFELDSSIRSRLTRAIHDSLTSDIEVEYTRDPELLCGIELTSGQQKLGWNLAGYMDDLTARISDAFSPHEIASDEEE